MSRKPYIIWASGECAIENGFEKIYDPGAFSSYVYVKDGLKWIHDLYALKRKLGVTRDQDLVDLGYDVETYKKLFVPSFVAMDEEDSIIANFHDCCVYPGDDVYMSDGMYLSDLFAA